MFFVNFVLAFGVFATCGECVRNYIQELEAYQSAKVESNCIKEALGRILSICRDEGVEYLSIEERKYLALKLTLCEMNNLHIQIPQGCLNLNTILDYDDCIKILEKIPQYWTSFSGNFREIKKICFEESLPYEKEQILSLYTNITRLFIKLDKDFSNSLADSKIVQNNMKQKLDELVHQVEFITDMVMKTQHDTMKGLKDTTVDLQNSFENSLELIVSLTQVGKINLNEMAVNLNFLNKELSEILKAIVNSGIEKVMSELKETVDLKSHEISDTLSQVVDDVKDKLEGMGSYLEETEKKEILIFKNLMETNNLVSRINEVLKDTGQNALVQQQNKRLNEAYINDFLTELFGELEESFLEVEERMHESLNDIDTQVSRTLKTVSQIDKKIESLMRVFQLASLPSFIRAKVINGYEFTIQTSKYVLQQLKNVTVSTEILIRLLVLLPTIPFVYQIIGLVTSIMKSSAPSTRSVLRKQRRSPIIFVTMCVIYLFLLLVFVAFLFSSKPGDGTIMWRDAKSSYQ